MSAILAVGRRPDVLAALRHGLVVSCQAREGEPLHGPVHMTAIARSVVAGGAVGVRIEGIADVAAVRAAVTVPVIGLWKDGHHGVYITPSLDHALQVAAAGADVVALDATGRPRRDGLSLRDTIEALRTRTDALVMADVSTVEEGVAAAAQGADLVATTLSGYTGGGPAGPGPDLDLVSRLTAVLDLPVVAEGRITTPGQAREALDRGAWTVVVGGAITRPSSITAGFVRELGTAVRGAGTPARGVDA